MTSVARLATNYTLYGTNEQRGRPSRFRGMNDKGRGLPALDDMLAMRYCGVCQMCVISLG